MCFILKETSEMVVSYLLTRFGTTACRTSEDKCLMVQDTRFGSEIPTAKLDCSMKIIDNYVYPTVRFSTVIIIALRLVR